MTDARELVAAISSLAEAVKHMAAVEERRLALVSPPVAGPAASTSRRRVPDIVLEAVKAMGGGPVTYSQVEQHTGRNFSSVYNALERLTHDGKLVKTGKRGSYTWKLA